MSVYRPRSRMISIRLSEDEYTGLKQLCGVTGARSVSDLAREAMRVLLSGAPKEDTLGPRIDSLDRKIEELSARLFSNGGTDHA